MMLGGNARLLEYFEGFGLTTDSLDRYYSKAAEYYRGMLKAEAEGRQVGRAPGLDEGREFYIQPSRVEFKVDSYQPVSSTQPRNEGGFWSSASSFLGSAVSIASDFASETAARVREQGILDRVKSTASSMYDKSKEVTSNLYDAVKVRLRQDTGALETIKETSSATLSSVSNFARSTYSRFTSDSTEDYQKMSDEPAVSQYRPPTREQVRKEDEDFFAQFERQVGGGPKLKKLD
jgi:hypothetical protein